jgi:hypothetical protein
MIKIRRYGSYFLVVQEGVDNELSDNNDNDDDTVDVVVVVGSKMIALYVCQTNTTRISCRTTSNERLRLRLPNTPPPLVDDILFVVFDGSMLVS